MQKPPVVLVILDGWGYNPASKYNAIEAAHTPNFDALMRQYPSGYLGTHGAYVGLPEGQMGNSEVGHINIGSGRIDAGNAGFITQVYESGQLAQHPLITQNADFLEQTGGCVHLKGMLSDGGVHGAWDHVLALAEAYSAQGVAVKLHLLTDGRDVKPASALAFYKEKFLPKLNTIENCTVASVQGRFFAMDRDQFWEDRIKPGFDAIVHGKGLAHASVEDAIATAYSNGISDEFIVPCVIGDYDGIKDGDGLVEGNFRPDRLEYFWQSVKEPNFQEFDRGVLPTLAFTQTMFPLRDDTQYFYESVIPEVILASVFAQEDASILRVSGSSKRAHISRFIDGGIEDDPSWNIVVHQSPKDYVAQPDLTVKPITKTVIKAVQGGQHGLIIVNYPQADQTGHTVDHTAIKVGVEAVDKGLGEIMQAISKAGGTAIICADHGNAEQTHTVTGGVVEPLPCHTLNLVPLIVADTELDGKYTTAESAPHNFVQGAMGRAPLSAVATSLLAATGRDIPPQMTTKPLLRQNALDNQEAFKRKAMLSMMRA